MKNNLVKKIFLSSILLTMFLLVVSTASAADNNTNFGELVRNTSNNGVIELEEGTYNNNTTNVLIDKNLTIIGKGSDQTIIDARQNGRIFNIPSNGTLTLINLTLCNGGGVGGLNGGTILNQGNLLIQNCEFSNSSASWGGVISTNDNTFNLSIYNSTFINNTGTSGGVIYISSSTGGYFMVTNCTFANTTGSAIQKASNVNIYMMINDSVFINNYGRATAGAIYLTASDYEVFIINCTFINNSATAGGAIRNNGNCIITGCRFISNSVINSGIIYNGRNLTIINSTFTNNTASASTGVIYNSNYCNLTIINSTFSNNSARSYAGVLYNHAYGNVNLINSTFINNSAEGIGIVYNTYDANLNVTNSVFIGNTATYGGAIYNALNNGRLGNLNVTNSIFTSNIAKNNGGAVYSYGICIIDNSTFNNNTAMNRGGAIYNGGDMLVSGNNMSGNSAILGQMIYNSGTIGVLNLTYLNNSTLFVKKGQTVTLFANLTDDMGNTVTGQKIIFNVNGIPVGSAESIEGYATLNYTISEIDSVLPVNGSYDGSKGYPIILLNGLLQLEINTNSTVVAPNIRLGQVTVISGVASDENGVPVANIVVSVIVNGVNYSVETNVLGEWNLSFTPNASGIYSVVVSWDGNSTHNGFINETSFNVSNLSSNSTVVAPNIRLGQATVISGVASDENGVPVANVVLSVIVNGVNYSVETNVLGGWNLSFTPNASGIYSVIVSWNGNSTHNGFINETSFNVSNLSSNSTVVAPNIRLGQATVINGVASDENGKPIANVVLSVIVNGVNYSVETNVLGEWNLSFTPNASGIYSVIVSWNGNSTHNGFVNETSFNVSNLSSNSTVVAPNIRLGQATVINGVASDENGKPIANVVVNVIVNGVNYSVETNVLGEWNLSFTPNASGIYSVIVSWNGNSTHNGFINETSFNVSNLSSNSTVVAPNIRLGQATVINGVASDENGKPIANVVLSVIVNGVNYSVETNVLGEWNLSYTPNASGIYSVIVSWNGNSTHNGFINETNFNVSNLSSNSTVVAPNIRLGQATVINGVATDENGKPIANVVLSVIVNGVNYSVETNVLGEWNLSYTPNASGIYSVIVSWNGNSTHNGFTNETTFNVSNISTNSTIVDGVISFDKDVYQVNEIVHDSVSVVNNGMNTAYNVVVKLNLPSNFVLDVGSVFVSKGYFDLVNNLWYIGDLSPGENVIMTFAGRFTQQGQYTESIFVYGDNFNSSATFDAAIVKQSVIPGTIVDGVISFDKDVYQVNEIVHDSVSVVNNGMNTAYDVVVKLNLPSSFVLDKGSVFVSKGYFDLVNNLWYIGDLSPGENVIMTFAGRFTQQGQYTESIFVSGDNFNSSTSFDVAIVNESIIPGTIVDCVITFDKDEYNVNELVTGFVNVVNNGMNTAYDVVVKLNLPSNFVLDAGSVFVSKGYFDLVNNLWYIGNLSPGEEVIMDFTGRFIRAGTYVVSIETSGSNFNNTTDSEIAIVKENITPPGPIQPVTPSTPITSENNNNVISTAHADMKATGIPINLILIVLVTALLLITRRKQ